ncbi:hypothetical protein K2173_026197 [Erythroxylum novogranatense]|uniref:Polygalacturonase n=1 Tax=Erythroxylum novogranatense TaxID=1862640 RepID=A0AAV8SBJ5_9ROSI|nr:hypothetical protein K2173_026197 [Erythroxylum novogranatense]
MIFDNNFDVGTVNQVPEVTIQPSTLTYAPTNSSNTDGMHINDTANLKVSNCKIQTGDDCISIGQGVTNAYISGILCGPGHGIRNNVGSLGNNPDEKEVNGIFVSNCSLSNTTNGARIKTWAASPPSKPSIVEITDVHFKNMKGTTVSNVAVSFSCSSSFPCKGIELFDIDLALNNPRAKNSSILSQCLNAEIKSGGTQNPSPFQDHTRHQMSPI